MAELKASAAKRDANIASLTKDMGETKEKFARIEETQQQHGKKIRQVEVELDDVALQVSKPCLIMRGKGTNA